MKKKRGSVFLIFAFAVFSLFSLAAAQEQGVIYSGSHRGGDANDDGRVDIGDAVYQLQWMFQGGEDINCKRCVDNNGDGRIDITDAIYLLNFLFMGGPEPVYGGVSDGVKDVVAPEAGDAALENLQGAEGIEFIETVCIGRDKLADRLIINVINDDPNCPVPIMFGGRNGVRKNENEIFKVVHFYAGCATPKEGQDFIRKRIFYVENVYCDDFENAELIFLPASKQLGPGTQKNILIGSADTESRIYLEGRKTDDEILSIGAFSDAIIFGNEGDDVIWDSRDVPEKKAIIFGGDGDDRIKINSISSPGLKPNAYVLVDGGKGNDVIDSSSLYGGSKVIILGGEGEDTLIGGRGEEMKMIIAQEGSSTNDIGKEIFGGGGSDIILGSMKDDDIYAGAGDDLIISDSGFKVDPQELLSQHQTDYPYKDSPKRYDINAMYEDVKHRIQNLPEYLALKEGKVPQGTDEGGKDRIEAGCGNDIVYAGEGDDRISGSGLINPPSFDKGTDINKIICSSDNDLLLGGPGNDEIHGMEGTDIVYGGKDKDGENGKDKLFGDREFPLLSGKYPMTGQENYGDLICGSRDKDEITGDAPRIIPQPNTLIVNYLISGPRKGDSIDDLEAVCLAKVSGNSPRRICDELENDRHKEVKSYYILNGHVTGNNNPDNNPPWDENSFDPYDLAWPGDKRYCRNWDIEPGDKCMGSSLFVAWGPLKVSPILNIFPIIIQGDSFTDIILPDCGLYGPSDPTMEHMRWGDIAECRPNTEQCCVCTKKCFRGAEPRCTDIGFNCQKIGYDDTPLEQIEQVGYEEWEVKDLHLCNKLVWESIKEEDYGEEK